jgi:hypothetical protein
MPNCAVTRAIQQDATRSIRAKEICSSRERARQFGHNGLHPPGFPAGPPSGISGGHSIFLGTARPYVRFTTQSPCMFALLCSAENSNRMEGAMIELNYWPMEAERHHER